MGAWGHIQPGTFDMPMSASTAIGQLGYDPIAWIPVINQYLQINCACADWALTSAGAGDDGSYGGFNIKDFLENKETWWLDWPVDHYNPIAPKPVFEIMEAINNEMELVDGYSHDNDVPWWPANEISHIIISPVSVDGLQTIGEPIIQMSKHLLVNSDGSINNYSFTLSPGLYALKMFVPDYGFIDYYFEIDQTSVQSYPLSSYLNVTIFPVPLSDNQDLTVHSTAIFNLNYVSI